MSSQADVDDDPEVAPGSLRAGAGRPAHKPIDTTRKMVTSAVGMGLDQISISALLDITPKTLRKFYRHELDTGAAKANLSVARSLYERASGGKDTIASIFWLKARAGWVDTVKNTHEGLPERITVSFALEPPNVEHKVIDVTPKEET
jgi:hypothetical protein|tara:strand:+ start:130 stop:570 length:441 start_codon:yes stop_codon:yes gene_type:complete